MELDKAIAELDTLVHTLERDGDERSLLLLQLVDAIHRPGIEALAQGDAGNPAAQALLAIYGLVDLEPWELVEGALDRVRPYVTSHGGEIELLDIDEADGIVRVRMSGACDGCAASAMTLRRGIETAIREDWPEVREVVADQPRGGGGPQLLQIESLGRARKPVFERLPEGAEPEPGELSRVVMEGVPVLLANLEGEVYAFRDACPVDGASLEGSRLTGAVLVCPWHNCAYDARSGRRVDDEPAAEPLAVVPVALRDEQVEVAVNVA